MFVNSCLLCRPSLWNLVSIYNKLHDHNTKKLCVSTVILPTSLLSSLCFDSKLVVVVGEIDFMDTRLYHN